MSAKRKPDNNQNQGIRDYPFFNIYIKVCECVCGCVRAWWTITFLGLDFKQFCFLPRCEMFEVGTVPHWEREREREREREGGGGMVRLADVTSSNTLITCRLTLIYSYIQFLPIRLKPRFICQLQTLVCRNWKRIGYLVWAFVCSK